MLTIGTLLAFHGERTGDRIGGWCFLVIVPLGTWLFFVRPRVDLTATALVVRNPVRSHYIRLQDIKAAHPLNTGLALEMRDGREVVAWALQQGLLMTLLRSNTRSDKASDAILAAARAARAGDTTP